MDLLSEKDVYILCQYFQDKGDDRGTALFVEHLYKTGELKYTKALFEEPFSVHSNGDIAYLVGIEKILESFAIAYDKFVSSIDGNFSKELYPDSETDSHDLIGVLKSNIKPIAAKYKEYSLERLFLALTPYCKSAVTYFEKLRVKNSGIHTNIKTAEDFLRNISRIRFEGYFKEGKYFMFLK